MSYQALREIKSLYFSANEVADILGIQFASAKVLCSRYVKKGLLVRIKRNIYLLRERWDYLTPNERLQIANLIQVPSYISLTTALSYYEVTTQVQQGFVESVALQRSYRRTVMDTEFTYTLIPRKLYYGFVKINNLFIAEREKAFLDALYLSTLGRYSLDNSALDLSKLDPEVLKNLSTQYPERVIRLWRNYDYS
ncbi:MAG: hypothetical protein GXO92_08280 [FCB group bacterium]|nr:hypothetical protein [FCB group bacterium]